MLPIALALVPAAGAKVEDLDANGKYPTERVLATTEAAKVEEHSAADGVGTMAPCPASATPEILTSGVATAGTDTTTADCHYKISVPAPAGLRIRAVVAWVGSSDHDVFVKQGVAATTSPYYCSETGTSTVSPAQCSGGATLVAGDYWIRVKRWTGTSDFTLTVFVETPPPSCSLGSGTTTLSNNVAQVASLTADTGANCQFVFNPPLGEDTVQFTLAATTPADFDLYVRKGAAPTTSVYDCRPFLGGSSAEICNVPNDGTPVYAMVNRFSGSGAFTLTARAFSPCSLGNGDNLLSEGSAVTAALTSDAGASCFFAFNVAEGFDVGQISMTPASGDFDLFLKVASRPTTTSFGCSSILDGAVTDACGVGVEPGQVVYAMVTRFSGSGDFTITASSASSCGLGPGVHPLAAGTNSGSLMGFVGGKCLFSYEPAASADFAHYVLPATSPNDFDLYVKSGSIPTTSSYDCRPYFGGSSVEVCDVLSEGTQYVMVRRFSGAGAFSLDVSDVVIPTLENGVPAVGNVATGAMQYFKLVVPGANEVGYAPSQIAIAIGGDVSELACAEIAAAELGADCDTEAPEAPGCADVVEPAAPGTCAAIDAAADEACLAVGGCPAAPSTPATRTDADLYVRHARGLPTTSVYDCRPYAYGSTEACAFSNEGAQAKADANAAYGDAAGAVSDAMGGAGCVDPTIPESCVPDSPLPAGLPSAPGAVVVPFKGAGKYFIAVRGFTGPADYVLTAVYA